jgi:hypothetical protein
MFLDAAVVALAVRTTARISAVLLAANLIVAARRLTTPAPGVPNSAAPDSNPARRARDVAAARNLDLATFAAFLVSHTIHFASVALLALATDGSSMRDAGGWTAAMVVGILFYLGGWGVVRGKRRPAGVWMSAGQRRREIGVLSVIWLIFFQAFALRFDTPLFAVLALGLVYSLVRFLAAALRSPTDAASQSAPASV